MAHADEQTPPDLTGIRKVAKDAPGLKLLVLHGSRSRGGLHAGSDWDFGYLAGPGFDPIALLAKLVEALGTDAIDLADLERANGLLRYEVASSGRIVFESRPDEWEHFWLDAVSFWCDMEPVFREGYEGVLARFKA